MNDLAITLWAATWGVLIELAPSLLLGAAIARLLHVLLPAGFASRQLRGLGGVLKAVAFGMPLPLCSYYAFAPEGAEQRTLSCGSSQMQQLGWPKSEAITA